MSLNLQNLIDKINTRVAGIDSATSLNDIIRLTELNTRISGSMNQGAIQYRSQNQLPAVSLSDSASGGQIAFVADDQIDSDGRFYFRSRGGWINLQTATDSDENYSIANPSAGGSTPSFVFQGSSYGYASGGGNPSGNNTVDKYPLASDGNATDVGDLTDARRYGAGHSSLTHAYTAGGGYTPPAANFRNIIDRYPFSTDENATDVGDLFVATQASAAATSSTDGYLAGGGTTPSPAGTNIIQKYPLTASSSSTDTADLTITVTGAAGATSSTDGYAMGGTVGGTVTNVVDKFPFSSDANSTDVGDTTVARQLGAGGSSTTHGYLAGGYIGPTWSNVIDKFPFSSDGNLTDVGNLYQTKGWVSGVSSTTSGYANGGIIGPITTYTVNLDKYSFASDGNGSDVGNLTLSRFAAAGHQV